MQQQEMDNHRFDHHHTSNNRADHLWGYLPYLLAAGTLGLILWAGIQIALHPTSGLTWSYSSGVIYEIDPGGPASGLFQVGDRILTIDELPSYQARGLPGYRVGERVEFVIERDQKVFNVVLELAAADISNILLRHLPLLAAFLFWAVGLFVFALGPSIPTVRFFFLFNLCFAWILALGSISAIGPLWSGWFFNLLLWWIGPLLLHTHLLLANFPDENKWQRPLLTLYGLALIFSGLDFIRLFLSSAGPWMIFKALWISSTILAAVGVIIFYSRNHINLEHRRNTRIAGLAALTAYLPFVMLSLLPDALFDRFILPYEFTFLALPILPVGYSFAILRYKLIHLERYLNRGATNTLVVVVLGSLYGLTHFAAQRAVRDESQLGLLEFLTVITLILWFQPVYKLIQKWVDRIFYGGWYDDRAAARQISLEMTLARSDIYIIALTLCKALQKAVQLEYAHLLLNDGRLVTNETAVPEDVVAAGDFSVEDIMNWFLKLEIRTGRKVGPGKELFVHKPLPDFRSEKILGPKPQYWLLLDGRTSYQGMLVLGGRRGGGELAPSDLETLAVVIRQAGAALENESLLQELRCQDEQNRILHRQISRIRDRERKRLARELHDCTIQSLVGINYQLAEVRSIEDEDLSRKLLTISNMIQNTIGGLREVCADLRPPALDTLGLLSALHSRVAEFSKESSFKIDLDIDLRINDADVPDDVALCLYRFISEGLMNVQKHARAEWALVSINLSGDDKITVLVEDDGTGFTPPQTLEELVEQSHFGLVGMKEQIENSGGQFWIDSSPGHGCRLMAHLPFLKKGVD